MDYKTNKVNVIGIAFAIYKVTRRERSGFMDTLRSALNNRPNRKEEWLVWLEMGFSTVVLSGVTALCIA